jgi:hypothetical protein
MKLFAFSIQLGVIKTIHVKTMGVAISILASRFVFVLRVTRGIFVRLTLMNVCYHLAKMEANAWTEIIIIHAIVRKYFSMDPIAQRVCK